MSNGYYPTAHVFEIEGMRPEDLEAWSLAVLDQLYEDPSVIDPDVGGSSVTGRVEFEFMVEAASRAEVFGRAEDIMRRALEAADRSPHDWVALDVTGKRVDVLPVAAMA